MSFFFNHNPHYLWTFASKNENDMHYQEFQPSPALKPYIDRFWVHAGILPNNQIYRCVPSGTASIIFGTSEGEEWLQRGSVWEKVPQAFFTGLWTEPAVLKTNCRIGWFGIQFNPEMFVQLFRQPLREMENVALDVRSVFGKCMDELSRSIADATDVHQRIALAEAYLKAELNKRNPEEAYFTEAIRLIRQHAGLVSTEALSKKVFVGERQLQRAFREYFGVTPKTYGRLMRFNKATALLKNATSVNWGDVTYNCGYADQAHFIRDFREFSGASPTALIADPTALIALPG